MITNKAYKFRLNPSKEQAAKLLQFSGSRRFIWNWALEQKQTAYKEDKTNLNYYDLATMLPALKQEPEYSWLSESHSQILQQSLRDLDVEIEIAI